MMRFVLVSASLLVLAACSGNPVEQMGYVYRCDDGQVFRADFGVKEEVSIRPVGADKTFVLPQITSGSGVHYEFKDYSFWGKGNEATWKAGKDAAETRCDVIGK